MPTGFVGARGQRFRDGGSKLGFRCQFKVYPQKKAGYAILTNGDQGGTLHIEIAQALVRTYGWE